MRAKAVVTCLALMLGASGFAQPDHPAPAPPAVSASAQPAQPASPLLPKLTEKVIREAVRETLAEPIENPRRHAADTIRGNSYTEFSHQFSAARVPDCLHSDGLKRQPTFFLGGILALPFIAVAKLRGVCN
jgi:hypothetical protein